MCAQCRMDEAEHFAKNSGPKCKLCNRTTLKQTTTDGVCSYCKVASRHYKKKAEEVLIEKVG
jgi:hypothetical protein